MKKPKRSSLKKKSKLKTTPSDSVDLSGVFDLNYEKNRRVIEWFTKKDREVQKKYFVYANQSLRSSSLQSIEDDEQEKKEAVKQWLEKKESEVRRKIALEEKRKKRRQRKLEKVQKDCYNRSEIQRRINEEKERKLLRKARNSLRRIKREEGKRLL